MLREITQAAGRYRPGNKHDYPRGVWNKIASDLLKNEGKPNASARNIERKLNSFSREIEFNPSHAAMTRGERKVPSRPGMRTRVTA